jgi:anti-anti-sigma factor
MSVVYTLGGQLIGRPECYEFLEDARSDISDGYIHVILQMDNLQRINSTGIGILAALYTSARQKNGVLCVVNAPERMQWLLQITQLSPHLIACDSVASALAVAEKA